MSDDLVPDTTSVVLRAVPARRAQHLCLRVVVASVVASAASLGAALALVSDVHAQTAPAVPPAVGASTSATDDSDDLKRTVEELRQRIEAQEQENARQKAELEKYAAERAEGAAAAAAPADAQLAELIGMGTPESFEPSIKFYGFADTGLQRAWGGFFDNGLSQSDKLNFILGNVNLYIDATPAEHLRFLTEVRFTTLPDGSETNDPALSQTELVSTSIFDQTSAAGGIFFVHWGAIILERAQIEWTPTDVFGLRVGYFLTPYGIWNVDHGSPTRIMLRPPLFMSLTMFPERQTGVEAFGVLHALPWDFGYSVYVSNGRTWGTIDFSDDKAIGGRLTAKTRRPFPMLFGFSLFRGTEQNVEKSVGPDASGQSVVLRKETVALSEWAAGLDASLDIDALRIRAEFTARRVVYEPGKRAPLLGIPQSDITQSAAYLMLAYRLPWLGLEPLVVAEYARWPTPAFGEVVVTGSVGLNVYFNPALTLRLQYSYSTLVDFEETDRDHSNNFLHILASRLIISY